MGTLANATYLNAILTLCPSFVQGYKVSLDSSQHTILVQLIKSCCTIAFVRNYRELAKFNIRCCVQFVQGLCIIGPVPLDPLRQTSVAVYTSTGVSQLAMPCKRSHVESSR